jgi:hypothetical protein
MLSSYITVTVGVPLVEQKMSALPQLPWPLCQSFKNSHTQGAYFEELRKGITCIN